jgi:hypothetical protein
VGDKEREKGTHTECACPQWGFVSGYVGALFGLCVGVGGGCG